MSVFEIRESSQYGAFLFSFESDSAKLNQTPIWIIWAVWYTLTTSNQVMLVGQGKGCWKKSLRLVLAVVGETDMGGMDRSLHEKKGEDWRAEIFVRKGGSHLSVSLLHCPPQTHQKLWPPLFSNLPHPQVWASKTLSFSFPSSNLFPVPRYHRKGEALEWFCHQKKPPKNPPENNKKTPKPNQTKPNKPQTNPKQTQTKLAQAPFKIPSPKQGFFSSRMVRQRQSGTPSPARKYAPLVWSSEVTPEVKKTPFCSQPCHSSQK